MQMKRVHDVSASLLLQHSGFYFIKHVLTPQPLQLSPQSAQAHPQESPVYVPPTVKQTHKLTLQLQIYNKYHRSVKPGYEGGS